MISTGPTAAVRAMVHARAGECCELCGLWAFDGQIHHRQPRGIGGSSRSPPINNPSNLVLLCAPCHEFIERADRAAARRYGWIVPRGFDPLEYPYLLLGGWVLLDDSGHYTPIPNGNPEEQELF